MDSKTFVTNCTVNPYRIPEITNNITGGSSEVSTWVEGNPGIISGVKPANVSKLLMTLANKLISAGASMDIVKNVYSEYTVIACILASQNHIISQKGLYNKIGKLFYQILANSSHYTVMYKKSRMKHARTLKYEPKMPVELFWLIPMFLNPAVFNQFDIKAFTSLITGYAGLCLASSEFESGYKNIINGISTETPDSYRQFIREAVMEIQSNKVIQSVEA